MIAKYRHGWDIKHSCILTHKNLHLFLAKEIVHCLDSVYCKNPFVHTGVAFYTHIEN